MAKTFQAVQLNNNQSRAIKIPKGFGHEAIEGSVVELSINTPEENSSLFIELYDKQGSAKTITKKTAKNFLKYTKKGLYDDSFFHRSVDNFVIQGGGFTRPDSSFLEGGRPDSIKTFSTIKNEPGNPNITGSVAMAKLGGDPNSATSQWFINLAENEFLDSQNGGFTVFGAVLGEGMNLVETMASSVVVPAGQYFQNPALNELPLWQVNVGSQNGVEIADVRPDDYLSVIDANKLGKKDALATYEVSSSDPAVVSASINKKNKIKLKASNNKSGKAEITVKATSRLDGTSSQESFDVIVGSQRRARTSNKRQSIDLFVDSGSLDSPFYNFYDSEGKQIQDLIINPRHKYTFHRLDDASTHPFYISELDRPGGTGTGIKYRGNGSADHGIKGDESFKLRFNKSARERLVNDTGLRYFCTSHPTMEAEIAIKGANTDPTPFGTEPLV